MPDSSISALADLAAARHGVLTRSEAADCGLSRARIATALRQGWLHEPYHGVLVVAGTPRTFESKLLAAVLAHPSAVASHRSAARLHGLDGLAGGTTLEISIPRSRRWQYGNSAVVAHHLTPLDDIDLTVVDAIPTTTLARTLADLGSVVRRRDLVTQALTDARRRGIDLADLRETASRLRRPNQVGPHLLARLLDAIPFEGRVPDSWFEEVVARCLDHPRLPRPVPQYEVTDDAGRFVARVDLAFPSVRLAVEAHSHRFHFGPEAASVDELRDARLMRCGWEVLYLGWHATTRPDEVARLVADVFDLRRRELRPAQ